MRGENKLVNVRFNDGNVKRLPKSEAGALVNKGNAKFISHTLFKAAQAGVSVKKGQTERQIKKAIRSVKKTTKVVEEKERQPQQRRRKKDRSKTESVKS